MEQTKPTMKKLLEQTKAQIMILASQQQLNPVDLAWEFTQQLDDHFGSIEMKEKVI